MINNTSLRYAFWVVLTGIGAVVLLALFAMTRWTTATDVAAVISSGAAVVGTIVGAYFGVQAGSAGKEKAEEQRDRAELRVQALTGSMPPPLYEEVRQKNPALFQ
jgi:hypothetical protein